MRINKFIAGAGICSRREAEKLIEAGKILVNHLPATIGQQIDPDNDEIKYNNKVIKINNTYTYIMLNKPNGYICTNSTLQGPNIFKLLTNENNYNEIKLNNTTALPKLVIVGRLDKDSEGLVLLTNNNDLVNKIIHPKYEHEKEYEATLSENIKSSDIKLLEKSIIIKGVKYQGIKIEHTVNPKTLKITLKEGKNRQIKKIFGNLGYNLIKLTRLRIDNITLDNLPIGKWKYIDKIETSAN